MKHLAALLFALSLGMAAHATETVPFETAAQLKARDPALYQLVSNPATQPATYVAAAAVGWNSTVSCGKTIGQWNMFYACTGLHTPTAQVSGNITTLWIGATVTKGNLYPLEMRIYVYDGAQKYLGMLSPGYFAQTPVTRAIDVTSYNFPMSSSFRYYFRINGGGSSVITQAPTVISTYISPSNP